MSVHPAPIKVGLLGAGYILKSHAKALAALPHVRLHAVCDLSRGRAEAAAAEFGIPHVLDSLDALAASDCDAIHVLLPPAAHLDAAGRLMEAGKHVFIEKPMGLDAAACEALAERARVLGVKLGVNHNFLFMPAYQPIRDAARDGTLGPIDRLAVDWLYPLPLIDFGPFDNWMLRQPANLMFEVGPHLCAFLIDLLGEAEVRAAYAGRTIDLPGGAQVHGRWQVIGEGGGAAFNLTMSFGAGEAERAVRVRALGAVAELDLERGIGWWRSARSDNLMLDNARAAAGTAWSLLRQSGANLGRFIGRTLRKQPGANPFEESVAAAVAAFHAAGPLDPRLDGAFGAKVMRLCEDICTAAGVPFGEAAPAPRSMPAIAAPPSAPAPATVLVVGGTGFIGRRLVERLVRRGVGVRVLTRNLSSARIDLAGLDVDLVQGSHGDQATLKRALAGIRTVYHLAKADGQRWDDYVRGDIEPTRRLAEATMEAGVDRFIYTGTIDSYASAGAREVIDDATPLDPAIRHRNLYARSKAACEALLKDLARREGLPLVILRPGIVIGAGSPPAHWGVGRFVSPTRVTYWGDGRTRLPFVLVDDVAAALDRAGEVQGIEGEEFLLTDAPLMTARDYVAAVEARAGLRLQAESRAVWRYWLLDAVKEGLKGAIRHRNARSARYHDWNCRAHRARYDSAATSARLGWKPAGTRDGLVAGINASVDRFMRGRGTQPEG